MLWVPGQPGLQKTPSLGPRGSCLPWPEASGTRPLADAPGPARLSGEHSARFQRLVGLGAARTTLATSPLSCPLRSGAGPVG